jgi:hypothetical protein
MFTSHYGRAEIRKAMAVARQHGVSRAATITGISKGTIQEWKAKYRVKCPRSPNSAKLNAGDWKRVDWRKPVKQIARELGVSPASVRKARGKTTHPLGIRGSMAARKTTTKKSGTSKSRKSATAAAKKPRKVSGKRELIKPKGDARYIRRDAKGRIKESDDVGRSLKQDRARKAKTKVKSGQGDRGDR